MENRNYTNKVINKLVDENGNEFNDTKNILNCQLNLYKNLYDDTNLVDDTPLQNILGDNPSKLSDLDSSKVEGEITYAELSTALRNIKNNKSPGLDGFTMDFFLIFWTAIGIFILRSLNYGYRSGSLSVTQKQGIITCLQKPNKSRENLKNWRPISLLNIIYKMASAVISNRLKLVLHNLIHEDQKGFIAGRFIGENIRLIYDVLFETKNHNIPGLLLSIDFEKAFDTVSWKFISKTLDYFNFGDSVKTWIKLFQNGAESSILQNGFISAFLCAEILEQMVRKNENIKGIKINNKEYKISQYSDDTKLLLDGSGKSLRNTLEMLYTFYNMSGLKINIENTKAIWIGALSNSERKMCGDFQLDWTQGPFKSLGVNFATEVWDLNTNDILTKVKCVLKQWTKREITLIGKIAIIKSLALSKFVHLFISLPDPPKEVFKQLERMFYNFIWNNGPDRLKRKILTKNLAAGGLRMVHLYSFTKALKITWLRRILQQTGNTTWSTLSNINFAHLFIYGGTYASQETLNVINPFWRDFFKGMVTFLQCL